MATNGVSQRDSITSAQEEVNNRRRVLESTREQLQDTTLSDYARNRNIGFSPERFRYRKTLTGHTGKIYSLDWSSKDTIVSASSDGRLIVWNAMTSQKTHAIKLQCPWVIACAFSQDGETVCCGGLDNIVSVFRLKNFDTPGTNNNPSKVLQGHRGYISCCRFVPGKQQIISSSGDHTCILWDIEAENSISTFGGDSSSGHTSDVMSLSINKQRHNEFVTGSCDKTARLWDVRTPNKAAQLTFFGHRADINSVEFLPDGYTFGTGSDDGTCKLYDVRYGYMLQEYTVDLHPHQVNSIAFSHSGRILFASYSSQKCYLWDVLTARRLHDLFEPDEAHSKIVSCMRVALDGSALCTGSWDKNLKIWAFERR